MSTRKQLILKSVKSLCRQAEELVTIPKGSDTYYDGQGNSGRVEPRYGGLGRPEGIPKHTPPEQWPNVQAQLELLYGQALVQVQTLLEAHTKRTDVQEALNHLANYYKHRNSWDAQWTTTRSNANTRLAVINLGGAAPTIDGQLTKLLRRALNLREDSGHLLDHLVM